MNVLKNEVKLNKKLIPFNSFTAGLFDDFYIEGKYVDNDQINNALFKYIIGCYSSKFFFTFLS